MAKLVVDKLSKIFNSHRTVVYALKEISLTVASGEFVSIVGPSGCGKTTLLSIIAGILPPSSGDVLIDGQLVSGPTSQVGYVTQQDNLLPWRRVLSNAEIALELRKVPKEERRHLVLEWLGKAGLLGFEDYYPHELSGGMRKRVSLVRTLVYNPEILLMDEPFAALDAQTKIILQDELLKLWQDTNKTIVYVTHDLGEAIVLSDRIFLLSSGGARTKAIYEVNLKRPRRIVETQNSKEFSELYRRIWTDLESEVKRSILAEREALTAAKQETIRRVDPF